MRRADSFGSCFDLPVSVGTGPEGPVPLNHDLHASALQLCDTQHTGDWESHSLEEGQASTESVFSGLYLQQVFYFSDVRPAGLP